MLDVISERPLYKFNINRNKNLTPPKKLRSLRTTLKIQFLNILVTIYKYFPANYEGEEPLIDSRIVIFKQCELQPGTYDFKFCFPLPHNLPYSIRIFTSSINYFIEAEFFYPKAEVCRH